MCGGGGTEERRNNFGEEFTQLFFEILEAVCKIVGVEKKKLISR